MNPTRYRYIVLWSAFFLEQMLRNTNDIKLCTALCVCKCLALNKECSKDLLVHICVGRLALCSQSLNYWRPPDCTLHFISNMVLTKLKPRNRLSFVRLNSEKVGREGLAKVKFPTDAMLFFINHNLEKHYGIRCIVSRTLFCASPCYCSSYPLTWVVWNNYYY